MHIPGWWHSRRAPRGLGLAVLLALFGCHRDAPPPNDKSASRAPQPADTSAAARLAALDTGLRQIEQGLRTAKRDRWDPAYVVAQVGRDPGRLLAWVRDSTAWIPYQGLLRGPVGVLMDRYGNSLDRALLLAKLLKLAGHEVRLARGRLDQGVADERLPSLVTRRRQLAGAPTSTPPEEALRVSLASTSTGPATDQAADMIAAQQQAARALEAELDRRVREQATRLLAQTTAPPARRDWNRRRLAASRALQDHWWVQRRDGERWMDLDPLDAGATPLETLAPDAIPDSLRHRIAVRVIGEEWTRGRLAERVALADTLRPADLTGRALVLQLWPASWPAELHPDPASPLGLRGVALEQHAWSVALTADGQPLAEGRLTDGTNDDQNESAGPLGGLGGAIRQRAASARHGRSSELTSAWIEYVLLAPGAPPRNIRRAIFDLLGPAARAAGAPDSLVLDERQQLVRSLALMIRTDILPVTQRMPSQYALHLMMERLAANRPLLLQLVGHPDADRPADSVLATATPPLSALYALAYARTAWSPVAGQLYVDRLGLLTQHRHPALMGNGFGMRGAVDVAMGEMGVPLDTPNAFAVRLRQGVFDTNAEGMWWTGVASLNTGEVFGGSTGWTALTPTTRERVTGLKVPDDARWRIGQDLAAGFTVVAPEAAIPVGDERYVGWWRIDPTTGTTRGVSGNGWGQCNAEYSVNLRTVAWAYARGFSFEFVLCQAIAQSINSTRGLAAQLQKRKLWFWWLPPIKSSDPMSVFKGNTKTCLVSAMAAGFLATMPILLMSARAEEMLAAARAAAAERDAAARAAAEAEAAAGGTPRRGSVGDGDPLAKTQPDLGRTQPDLGRTQPDLGRTQPDLGSTQPGREPGFDGGKTQDLGHTSPDVKTSPGTAPEAPPGARRPEGPKPTSVDDAAQKYRDAWDKWEPLQAESSNRTGDWIRENMKAGLEPEGQPGDPDYHPGRPADPDFNPDHLDELEAKMNEAGAARDKALAEVNQAADNYAWASKEWKLGRLPKSEPSVSAGAQPSGSSSGASSGGSSGAPSGSGTSGGEPAGCVPNCAGQSSSSGEQLMSGAGNVASSFNGYSWAP